MGKKPQPERKKLPLKTRLILILIVFVIVNLIFYFAIESSDDSTENEIIGQESEMTPEEPQEEKQYAKFNPPEP